MEALDGDGRFADFAPDEDWEADKGKVKVGEEEVGKEESGLTPKCRYWSLEEVTGAMSRRTPKHEFYTRDSENQNKKITVYSFQGNGNRWIKTVGDAQDPGNLHWQNQQNPPVVPCPRQNCPVIPPGAGSVSRGATPDC